MKIGSTKEVGSRIASERKALGLTQTQLAERIEITRGRLASYEDGRGCLRCGIALDICRNLVISEWWLATGEGDKDLYLEVERCLPDETRNKPFFDIFSSDIEKIYRDTKKSTRGWLFMRFNRNDHPETIKLAATKALAIYSKTIDDDYSWLLYWNDLLKAGRVSSSKYSTPPRERRIALNSTLSISKNGSIEPFQYEQLFDDLSLIGIPWEHIETVADEIIEKFGQSDSPVSIRELKETIYTHLKEHDQNFDKNFSPIYKKIYLWNGFSC